MLISQFLPLKADSPFSVIPNDFKTVFTPGSDQLKRTLAVLLGDVDYLSLRRD
jgi:hypothetical protein